MFLYYFAVYTLACRTYGICFLFSLYISLKTRLIFERFSVFILCQLWSKEIYRYKFVALFSIHWHSLFVGGFFWQLNCKISIYKSNINFSLYLFLMQAVKWCYQISGTESLKKYLNMIPKKLEKVLYWNGFYTLYRCLIRF